MTDIMFLPVSIGEAIDKLTILDIKYDKIKDKTKLNTSMIVIKCIIYDDTIYLILKLQ